MTDSRVEPRVSFRELAWAAFLSHAVYKNDHAAYMSVYLDTDFRRRLAEMPSQIPHEEVCKTLIDGFLNKWRSRLPAIYGRAICAALAKVQAYVCMLREEWLESVAFDERPRSADGGGLTIGEAITCIFDSLVDAEGIGPTTAAKVMGILNPRLFVMWDQAIANECVKKPTGHGPLQGGYLLYLRQMQGLASAIRRECQQEMGIEDPAAYLCDKLEIHPTIPIAKFLDEYNWITITCRIQIPPSWHPDTDGL